MSDNFYISARRTVYKWWCVVYKPAYQLFHHGYWPMEKDPYVKYPSEAAPATPQSEAEKQLAQAMAAQIVETNRSSQHSVDDIIQSVETHQADTPTTTSSNFTSLGASTSSTASNNTKDATNHTANSSLNAEEIPAGVDDDVLARANEIMARLNQEAADDAAKKQAEIDKAKEYAAEQERLASIMKANSVNIDEFIEEGRSMQEHAENDKANDITMSESEDANVSNEFSI